MGDVSSLDIDLDINGSKKHYIIDRMQKYFGADKVLQVCTFSTEGSRSAIQTACRGLGYSKEDAHFISSLIPMERGAVRSVRECLYGNEEDGLSPITQFVNEVEHFPKLAETAMSIEGLINGHSVHAGGVVVFNEPYTVRNALMLSPKGVPTTQLNLDDTQACGAIKFDLLITDSTEKIQTALEYLIQDGKIEKLSSLRETYYKNLHPMNFDISDSKFYKIASENTVPDLFQFQTDIMQQALKKAKPSNLIELMAINSIVRLMSDGEEQPIDTFVKHRFNLNLWYEEMKEWGLTEEEIKVVEEYLLLLNGVADTQEIAMQLAMDERIASFTMQEATKLRKGIAKKKVEVIEEIHQMFMKKGLENGTSEQMLKYIWEVQIGRQLG